MSSYCKEKKYFLLKRRRRSSFLLINLLRLTPVVEGRLLLWIHKGIKESPLLLFSPDDDHTGDDTNHSRGVREIFERAMKRSEKSVHFSDLLLLFFSPSFSLFVLSFFYIFFCVFVTFFLSIISFCSYLQ